jgi:hypothetical protein
MRTKHKYNLTIPHDAPCMAEGCTYPAALVLNLRIRRRDTGAVYGPNIDKAYLCEVHGASGAEITLDYAPRRDGQVVTIVTTNGKQVTKMIRPVTGGHPGQGDLFA